ncbi:MAG: hypothetical protein Q8L51_03495, partial [Candidatus Amesbacteria bacterium]|nr:hypothetical protein [Candidatus Amesbacteria bacterium]
ALNGALNGGFDFENKVIGFIGEGNTGSSQRKKVEDFLGKPISDDEYNQFVANIEWFTNTQPANAKAFAEAHLSALKLCESDIDPNTCTNALNKAEKLLATVDEQFRPQAAANLISTWSAETDASKRDDAYKAAGIIDKVLVQKLENGYIGRYGTLDEAYAQCAKTEVEKCDKSTAINYLDANSLDKPGTVYGDRENIQNQKAQVALFKAYQDSLLTNEAPSTPELENSQLDPQVLAKAKENLEKLKGYVKSYTSCITNCDNIKYNISQTFSSFNNTESGQQTLKDFVGSLEKTRVYTVNKQLADAIVNNSKAGIRIDLSQTPNYGVAKQMNADLVLIETLAENIAKQKMAGASPNITGAEAKVASSPLYSLNPNQAIDNLHSAIDQKYDQLVAQNAIDNIKRLYTEPDLSKINFGKIQPLINNFKTDDSFAFMQNKDQALKAKYEKLTPTQQTYFAQGLVFNTFDPKNYEKILDPQAKKTAFINDCNRILAMGSTGKTCGSYEQGVNDMVNFAKITDDKQIKDLTKASHELNDYFKQEEDFKKPAEKPAYAILNNTGIGADLPYTSICESATTARRYYANIPWNSDTCEFGCSAGSCTQPTDSQKAFMTKIESDKSLSDLYSNKKNTMDSKPASGTIFSLQDILTPQEIKEGTSNFSNNQIKMDATVALAECAGPMTETARSSCLGKFTPTQWSDFRMSDPTINNTVKDYSLVTNPQETKNMRLRIAAGEITTEILQKRLTETYNEADWFGKAVLINNKVFAGATKRGNDIQLGAAQAYADKYGISLEEANLKLVTNIFTQSDSKDTAIKNDFLRGAVVQGVGPAAVATIIAAPFVAPFAA